ncbi:anaerobic C4-dicarboxylate transporter family protein [Frigidibacter sp. MR17.24]|uniref:anaerobic C4-dicarboxylate transporter family protein n=1 Tax=Frigidibacter sp. MR17.24 TaxID=3127345 RepID=UPI003012E848
MLILAVQSAIFLAVIATGIHFRGVAIGLFGGLGVLVLVLLFGLAPGPVPVQAMLIILTVVTAGGAMQLAGGLDYLIALGERLIRRRPGRVTYVAPLATYVLCAGAGTGNVFCSLLPVIYEVSVSAGVRPERPLALSATAGQLALVASPVSAAMIAMVGLLAPSGFTLGDILVIVVPASVAAILVGAFVTNRLGAELADDPEFRRRCAAGVIVPQMRGAAHHPVTATGRRSAMIFGLGLGVVMAAGFSGVRPLVGPAGARVPLDTGQMIQMVMLATAALIVASCRVRASEIPKSPLFGLGLSAMVTLFGIGWMASTLLTAHAGLIAGLFGAGTEDRALLLGAALFSVSAVTASQSSATLSVIPIGLAVGLPPAVLVAVWPAVIGVLFLPVNGSQFASVEIDQTGTTRVGALIVNHSFLVPVLICTAVSVGTGLAIARLLF